MAERISRNNYSWFISREYGRKQPKRNYIQVLEYGRSNPRRGGATDPAYAVIVPGEYPYDAGFNYDDAIRHARLAARRKRLPVFFTNGKVGDTSSVLILNTKGERV